MYSTHDWTVAQSLAFFNATNGNFTNVPFASQFVIELHSTEDCTDASCFWVEVFSNGLRYAFADHCPTDPERCTYPEFQKLLDDKGFVTSESGYKAQCATPWTPPGSLQELLYVQRMFTDYYTKLRYI